jgi:hypothetical protein
MKRLVISTIAAVFALSSAAVPALSQGGGSEGAGGSVAVGGTTTGTNPSTGSSTVPQASSDSNKGSSGNTGAGHKPDNPSQTGTAHGNKDQNQNEPNKTPR